MTIHDSGGKALLGVAAAFFILGIVLLPLCLPLMVLAGMTYDTDELRQGDILSRGGVLVAGTPALPSRLMGALAWRKQVTEIAEEVGVDPLLVLSMMAVESGGNQNAVSYVGAFGLMQLMPDTARGMGINPKNALENIRGGAMYIKDQLNYYDGNLKEAIAAYNAGPGNVPKGGGVPNIPETRNYVDTVLAYYEILKKSEIQAAVNPGAAGMYGPVWYEGYQMVTLPYADGKCEVGSKPLLPAEGWENPVPGAIKSDSYGMRLSPVTNTYRCHYGVDLAVAEGTPVHAPATAKVVATVYDPGYGKTVILDHGNGVFTWYAHLSAIKVDTGEIVEKGTVIAESGNTGAWTTGDHLHMEVHTLEVDGNQAVMRTHDPEDYIGRVVDSLLD